MEWTTSLEVTTRDRVGDQFQLLTNAFHCCPKINTSLVPSVPYAFENVVISLTTLVPAWFSFGFTLYVILPLSFIKEVKFNSKRQEGRGQDKPLVLLAVGVSQGLAFNVLKQYTEEKDMFIVAAAAFGWWSISDVFDVGHWIAHATFVDELKSMVTELVDTSAVIQIVDIDLSGSRKQTGETLSKLDKQYGLFSHLLELSGAYM